MRRGQMFYSKRLQAYMDTYFYYGLGFTYTPFGERVKNGFLQQDPNPDYDKWLPENCKPVYFKDWLVDKIPSWLPRPKIGPRGSHIISPRPIVCVENGKLYRHYREADKDLGVHNCKNAAHNQWFCGDMRFTYIDPFMEDNGLPWQGFLPRSHYNPNSSRNNSCPVYIEETGERFNSIQECCEALAPRFNTTRGALYAKYKRHDGKVNGLTIKKEDK